MSFNDVIHVLMSNSSFDRDKFVQKYSKQLLARTPKDIMAAQRQQQFLVNVAMLLKWVRIDKVMPLLPCQNPNIKKTLKKTQQT